MPLTLFVLADDAGSRFAGDFRRAIGAVVVKDDNFSLGEQLTEFGYNATDCLFLLIAGDGYRDLRFFGGGIRFHEFNGGMQRGAEVSPCRGRSSRRSSHIQVLCASVLRIFKPI